MTTLGTSSRPLRVAVVGSGPSGFYATEALFKSGRSVLVDMFDRLPSPFGLVRGGVAPDHAKIKNVIRVYERIAASPLFSFFGNVTIGRDLSVAELQVHYDAVIFAYGAETDNRLGIAGEDLLGSHTATEFVGWYNGHPDHSAKHFDLSSEVAVVVGQGNVAMDVCRILAKTVDELSATDIAQHALDALASSRVKEIHIIGRRGPAQAKFTQAEIREFGGLADCDPIVESSSLDLNPESQAELDAPDNDHGRKNFAVLKEFSLRTASKRRRIYIHFLKGPAELRGHGRVEQVLLERNTLTGEPFQQQAVGAGVFETLDCGLVFRSVGYRGLAIQGLPFDSRRGVLPNRGGKILDGDTALQGVYAAGWIKRGPSGVIGTNKPDSQETVNALLEDLPSLPPCSTPSSDSVRDILSARGVRIVTFADWRMIDEAEIERGKTAGKPREKFTSIDDMLAALHSRYLYK